MAEYIVSARKYRPARFSDMVGQEQVATTLKNAIRTGHLAHSFLFCGPRGVGKTTAARILAKTINCENITDDFEACGQCNSCVAFQQNSSFNIHELDAASNNSVDDIRSLVDQVRFPPQSGKYKIYIIDEVHMLSQGAFNAFLKTLEEPPAYCKFILATTEKHKILPTILSRCQIFDFRRIGVETIVKHLKSICKAENINAEEDALHIVAQKADGGMRDALSMFDRLSSFSGGTLTYESVLQNLNVLDYDYFFKVTDSLLTENVSSVLQLFNEILRKGFEGDDFILGLCEHFRNLLFCKDPDTLMLMEVSDSLKQRYNEQSFMASADFLVNCLSIGNQCDVQYKASKNKRLTVEIALIKMCYVNSVVKAEPAESKKKSDKVVSETAKTETITTVNPPASNKPDSAPAAAIPAEKPVIQAPTITKSKKLITIDALKNGDITEEQKKLVAEPGEQFNGEVLLLNPENVALLWEEYAAKLPDTKRGLIKLFGIFKPSLNADMQMEVRVLSSVQQTQFEEAKPGILNFFNKRLGAEIDLLVIADKAVQTEKKPYTEKEKFDRLVQKNPTLKKMQQQFGLELDY
ncbi:MAG: DNA polymerase III subunit gamma/tau [Chitinophagales bacterium]